MPSTTIPATEGATAPTTISITSKEQYSPHPTCQLCGRKIQLHPSLLILNSTREETSTLSESSHTPITPEKVHTPAIILPPLSTSPPQVKLRNHPPTGLTPTSPTKRLSDGSEGESLLESLCSSTGPLDLPPMCQHCAAQLGRELTGELTELEAECASYKTALDDLMAKKADPNSGWCEDAEEARLRLSALSNEERDLTAQLAALESEEKALNAELEAKLGARKELADRDEELYRQLRDNHRTLIEQAAEQRALRAQINYSNEQLQRLQRINPLDLAFFIWIDGDYGTINGMRLGRLRHEVEWWEINAALGQTALLLNVLASRLGMQGFQDYEIIPCGSTTSIRCCNASTKQGKQGTSAEGELLPLYGRGGWRPFGQPSLDQALSALFDCACQLEANLRSRFPAVPSAATSSSSAGAAPQILPYRMQREAHKIVDKDSNYLVRMQLNSEERWTKAMKCLLLNLKRAIGIVINLRGRPVTVDGVQHHMGTTTATPPTIERKEGTSSRSS